MVRPLRSRKAVPAPSEVEATRKTPKTKLLSAPPAKKSTTSTTTAKPAKITRARAAEPETPPVAPTRKARLATIVKAAEVVVVKKSARSTLASNLKNKKSTRRAVGPDSKSPSPVFEQELQAVTPSTIIPSTPPRRLYSDGFEKDLLSPTQSSNAENYSPYQLPSFTSSPPIVQSTPKAGNRNRVIIDFSSDAGYTPPKKKVGSVERPRLQDLDAKTLVPIGIGDEDDDIVRLPSPTPRRPRGRPSGFLITEEEDDGPNDGPLPLPPSPLRRPEGGKAFLVAGGEFIIYSDPKSASLTPAEATPTNNNDSIMRPPVSSPTPWSPSRKRHSSEAAIDSEAEPTTYKITPPSKRTRSTRATASQMRVWEGDDPKDLPTNAIRNFLLPKRKKKSQTQEPPSKPRQERPSSVDGEAPKTPRRPRSRATNKTSLKKPPAKSAAQRKGKSIGSAKAKTINSASTRPLTSGRAPVTKTYTAKKALDNSANEPIAVDSDEGSSDSTPLPSGNPAASAEMADGRDGENKLKEIKKKFEEVDRWEMEFEDVSQPISDLVGSD